MSKNNIILFRGEVCFWNHLLGMHEHEFPIEPQPVHLGLESFPQPQQPSEHSQLPALKHKINVCCMGNATVKYSSDIVRLGNAMLKYIFEDDFGRGTRDAFGGGLGNGNGSDHGSKSAEVLQHH